ncbi:MAG: class I adenylate-forming enzyme family protein [Desulfobacter sp.]
MSHNIEKLICNHKKLPLNHVLLICNNKAFTCHDILNLTSKYTQLFIDQGIGRNHFVIVMVKDPVDYICIFLALQRVRAALVSANPDSTASEINRMVSDVSAGFIITGKDKIDVIKQADHDASIKIISCERVEQRSSCNSPDKAEYHINPDDRSLILMTSGSTGKSKYVIHSQTGVLKSAEMSSNAYGLNETKKVFVAAPIFHSAGIIPVLSAVNAGATCIIMPKFLPKTFVKIITRYQPDIVKAPAFIYRIIAKMPLSEDVVIHKGCQWYSGSSILSLDEKKKISDKFGVKIREMYATSETSLIAVENDDDTFVDKRVGKVLKDIHVLISDNKITVKTPSMAAGYIESGNEKIHDFDAYFFTGDLGEITKDNTLFVNGRESNRINVAGKKVSSQEVNTILQSHPGIQDSEVIGVTDKVAGEVPAAIVVMKEKVPIDELKEFCSRLLSSYKIPKYFYFVQEIEKNALQKASRHKLEQLIMNKRG